MLVKNRIYHLVAERAGLRVEADTKSVWELAIKERMALTDSLNLEAYAKLINSSAAEFQELVERLVVRESWFFRDRPVFDQIVQLIVPEWKRRGHRRPMRFLSLPCATGEEPYSLAMALLDTPMAEAAAFSKQFHIDAMDISKLALLHATRGLYSRNSFRSKELSFRDRYFDPVKEAYQLKKEVRDRAHFSYGNICDRHFLKEGPPYDLILCRNLLIYFGEEARRHALAQCKRLLEPDGLLIVAPAEAVMAQHNGFTPLWRSRIFRR